MSAGEAIDDGLLERSDELLRIGRVLDAAGTGEGRVVVVAAPAGLGKTKLLDAVLADAGAAGAHVLVARASELEGDFAFGVARTLLEAPVLEADTDTRAELLDGAARHGMAALDLDPQAPLARDLHTTIHGLYWLLVNIAAGGPLLIVVDDLQWVDEPSARWLAYTARRLERLPIVLAVAARTEPSSGRVELPAAASEARRAAVEEIAAHAGALRLEPAPLSTEATAELLARRLGRPADPAFARACRVQTGGNPFLLSELAEELAAEGMAPVAANCPVLEQIVPARVGETIRRHLERLGPDARALAGSLAVLGDGCDPATAGALAAIGTERALAAAAELVTAQVLADTPELRFRHPLLRGAVDAQIPALERAAQHGRAARLVAERGAADGRIAAHLLAGSPAGGDAWAVERLRRAARSARAQGVSAHAAVLLRRALAESPPPAVRGAVLAELGQAELDSFEPDAAEHLRAARDLCGDLRERADLAVKIGMAEYHAARHAEGVAVVLDAIEEARPQPALREEWLTLETVLGLVGRYDLRTEQATRGRLQALAATLSGATPAERVLIATAASESPGTNAHELYRATRQVEAATEERPWPDPAEGIGNIAMYLHAGRPDAAAAYADVLLAAARESGSPMRHAIAVACRGIVALDVGDLRPALADIEAAYEIWTESNHGVLPRLSAGYYALALTDLGELDRADALFVAYDLTGQLPERMFYNPMLHQRGMLRLAQRRYAEAEADFRELGRRQAMWNMVRPSPAWRSAAAVALIASGQTGPARELAAAELEIARAWDTPKAIALATHALALTASGDEAITGLRAALRLLEGTPWRLDRARVRLDLGAALRRDGRRREAREALARAMDEAHVCGADPVAERAAAELRASGARPRRRAISGREALTPSELRVAELAAAGRSNREIAQDLFVTMATVETHLSRVYRKLDITGRAGLAGALAQS